MTIRLGVIGTGLIWHNSHKHALEILAGRITVTAICARRRSTLDAAGVPGAVQFLEAEALLNSPDIDAVLVLTPIPLNAPTAIAALRAGKDVFLEKPAATGIEECRALMKARESSGRQVYVLEQAVYSGGTAAMKQLLREHALGEVVLFDRISHGMIDSDTHDYGGYGKTQWRQDARFPLGMLFDGGIHEIAELSALFGTPERVFASGRKWREGFGDYDEITMQFMYASGMRGVYSHSSAMSGAHCGFNIRGTKGTLHPNDGSLLLTGLDRSAKEIPVNESACNTMWKVLADACAARRPAPYSLADAVQDVAILDAVGQSIESGQIECVTRLDA